MRKIAESFDTRQHARPSFRRRAANRSPFDHDPGDRLCPWLRPAAAWACNTSSAPGRADRRRRETIAASLQGTLSSIVRRSSAHPLRSANRATGHRRIRHAIQDDRDQTSVSFVGQSYRAGAAHRVRLSMSSRDRTRNPAEQGRRVRSHIRERPGLAERASRPTPLH